MCVGYLDCQKLLEAAIRRGPVLCKLSLAYTFIAEHFVKLTSSSLRWAIWCSGTGTSNYVVLDACVQKGDSWKA